MCFTRRRIPARRRKPGEVEGAGEGEGGRDASTRVGEGIQRGEGNHTNVESDGLMRHFNIELTTSTCNMSIRAGEGIQHGEGNGEVKEP